MDSVDVKKKRGRRKKLDEVDQSLLCVDSIASVETASIVSNNIIAIIDEPEPVIESSEILVKKRGRKPKGGKLVVKSADVGEKTQPIANIILHLKCSTTDLVEHNHTISQLVTDPLIYNPAIPPSIMTYNSTESSAFSLYDNAIISLQNNAGGITQPTTDHSNESTGVETPKLASNPLENINYAYSESVINNNQPNNVNICQSCNEKMEIADNNEEENIYIKDINAKLKKIKIQLYKNTDPDKKSACFWCTYSYDNPPCYIPKYEMDDQIHGYGSFCRPECAVGFLMKENIDDSTKFERYHLLNQMYSKVYGYKKNIKPAPNPYYLLDKFYGNLSIQEYRKLLKTEHMLLVIDKPMTRILPELHEDSEDFIMNIYGGKSTQQNQSGVYKVKRQSEKKQGPTKNEIMKESFGF
jgi:hypothetical protein